MVDFSGFWVQSGLQRAKQKNRDFALLLHSLNRISPFLSGFIWMTKVVTDEKSVEVDELRGRFLVGKVLRRVGPVVDCVTDEDRGIELGGTTLNSEKVGIEVVGVEVDLEIPVVRLCIWLSRRTLPDATSCLISGRVREAISAVHQSNTVESHRNILVFRQF